MQVIIPPKGVPIKAWIDGVQLEDAARVQLDNIASMPFIHRHVAVMPDVHWGMGATVGSVIPTLDAIIPAAVGVDIGCGMMAVLTDLTASDLPDNLSGVRSAIEAAVPHGRTDNGGVNDRGAWGDVPAHYKASFDNLKAELDEIVKKHPKLTQQAERAPHHLGTLGGGNHFIEICLDTEGQVWVMLHSGSRGIGNRIGSYFIQKAKEDMKRWHISLPDQDLAYIPEGSEHFGDYMRALAWAQKFAGLNREMMMEATLKAFESALGRPITVGNVAVNCHHNYVATEHHFGKRVYVTRKGAVKIEGDKLGIIPGSMGAKSYIVRAREGEALRQSFCSCSHGAGRAMSRTEAQRRFTVEDHVAATAGIECRKDADVIDETPMAYKPIEDVMAAQDDHVEIVHTLRQVVCVKG